MDVLAHQAALAIAIAALAGAGFRLASLAAPAGLERVVAASALAAAAAVVEALLLGLVHAAGSPPALAAAAVATWLATRALVPSPALGAAAELTAWRKGSIGHPGRRAAIAVGGAVAGLATWSALHPYLGVDVLTYHLSEAVIWVQRGTTGSIEPLIAGLPVGNYPVTNEVLMAWGMGLSHSFMPVPLLTGAMLAIFLASGWLGLRTLGVGGPVAALALAAVCAAPITIGQIVQPQGDFAGLAWLTAAAALCAAAHRRPALLAPAVVAAGLAVGVKTTALPLALIALGAGAWSVRGSLRALAVPLGAAAAAAVAAGGVWYLRNLVQHGSPLWPLLSGPWGDPVPPLIGKLDNSLLERPAATLRVDGLPTFYRDQLAGAFVLVGGALLAPLWARTRAVFAASAATLVSLLLWANAPFTGVGDDPRLAFWPFNTLRYALPVIAAAALTLALASRAPGRARAISTVLLAVAVTWSALRYVTDAFLPFDAALVAALVVGAAAAVAIAPALDAGAARAGVAALALAAVAVALAAPGYAMRHAGTHEFDAALVRWFDSQSAWRDGERPITVSPTVFAMVAGDGLEHRLSLIDVRDSCASVARRVRSGWAVLGPASPALFPPLAAERCLAGTPPQARAGIFRIYSGGR